MKKFILLMVLCISVVAVGSAQAGVTMYYDLTSLGLGTTGLFDRQIFTTVDATSTYAAGFFPGATFTDVGDLQIGSFTFNGAAVGNVAGLNSAWELTGRWTDLSGTVDNLIPLDLNSDTYYESLLSTFTYTSGTASLFGSTTVDANFGAGLGSDDDVASTFLDGTLLASIQLISGNGSLLTNGLGADTGSTFTTWRIIDVPTGVWFDPYGNDMEALLEAFGMVEVNTLVDDDVLMVGGGYPGTKIHSRNTGDVEYAVPEPATMLLLGSGLLGLFGFKFKKKAK